MYESYISCKTKTNELVGNYTWWRHQMEPFSALPAIYAGNSPVTGEFPTQRPVTRIFDAFFGLRLNKRLRKQSWGWWFETPSRQLWRHCNAISFSFFGCLHEEDSLTKNTTIFPKRVIADDEKSSFGFIIACVQVAYHNSNLKRWF